MRSTVTPRAARRCINGRVSWLPLTATMVGPRSRHVVRDRRLVRGAELAEVADEEDRLALGVAAERPQRQRVGVDVGADHELVHGGRRRGRLGHHADEVHEPEQRRLVRRRVALRRVGQLGREREQPRQLVAVRVEGGMLEGAVVDVREAPARRDDQRARVATTPAGRLNTTSRRRPSATASTQPASSAPAMPPSAATISACRTASRTSGGTCARASLDLAVRVGARAQRDQRLLAIDARDLGPHRDRRAERPGHDLPVDERHVQLGAAGGASPRP